MYKQVIITFPCRKQFSKTAIFTLNTIITTQISAAFMTQIKMSNNQTAIAEI